MVRIHVGFLLGLGLLTVYGCGGGDGDGTIIPPPLESKWTGTVQVGTQADEEAFALAVDGSGNVVLAGYSKGPLASTLVENEDIVILKFNSSGQLLWQKQIGTPSFERARGAGVDSLGNIYVTGYTRGSLDGKTGPAGSDIILIKYDPSGNLIFVRQFGTPADDEGLALAVDRQGNVFVTGRTAFNLDGNSSAGNYDVFLTKFDQNGERVFTSQIGTANEDEGRGVAIDSSGNVFVVGRTALGLVGNSSAGGFDLFLAKFSSSDGSTLQVVQTGTLGNELATGVAVDDTGGVYVTGLTQGSLFGPLQGDDVFLIKFDSGMNEDWGVQFGSQSGDQPHGLSVDAVGDIYVTGLTWGNLEPGVILGGITDVFLAKFGGDGNLRWVRQVGTINNDAAYGVAAGSDNGVFVTGSTSGGLDGNASAGNLDIFLLKYDAFGNLQ